ncbi:hypothetical protein AO364_0102 [Moraxella catarrhalis]|nr:hypothetical protein AO364_0102 [Moraxella catarrhalis]
MNVQQTLIIKIKDGHQLIIALTMLSKNTHTKPSLQSSKS